jgi:hypothetical protein
MTLEVKVIQQVEPDTSRTVHYGKYLFHPAFVTAAGDMSQNSYFKQQKWSVFDTWCRAASSQYAPPNGPAPPAGAPVGWPYEYVAADPLYPGWYSPNQEYSLPLPIRIHAIKITIRVWDPKTEQSREVSLIQDM